MSAPDAQKPAEEHAVEAAGWPAGISELLPRVYQELRELAESRIRSLSPGASLQPTELVHEAFVRLNADDAKRWDSKRHFIAAAAMAMRSVLVDRARARGAAKRGGKLERVALDGLAVATIDVPDELLEVDGAIKELEKEDFRSAQVVLLRYYLGLGDSAIAQALGVTERTVRRDWVFAKAWLQRRLVESSGAAMPPDGKHRT
jgi:RNA polymerase sigma factor (TIGR02999 family)